MSRASTNVEAARAQVEDRVLVELADRRAVRALHVVGEDLELRLGVDRRVVGQQQRPVGLLGVGLLRVVPDDDLAVEDGAWRGRRGCPCRSRGSGSAAWRGRWSCGCRPGARRRRGTARSACTRRPRRRARATMSLRTSAPAERDGVRSRTLLLRAACMCMLADVERVDALLLDLVVIDARRSRRRRSRSPRS